MEVFNQPVKGRVAQGTGLPGQGTFWDPRCSWAPPPPPARVPLWEVRSKGPIPAPPEAPQLLPPFCSEQAAGGPVERFLPGPMAKRAPLLQPAAPQVATAGPGRCQMPKTGLSVHAGGRELNPRGTSENGVAVPLMRKRGTGPLRGRRIPRRRCGWGLEGLKGGRPREDPPPPAAWGRKAFPRLASGLPELEVSKQTSQNSSLPGAREVRPAGSPRATGWKHPLKSRALGHHHLIRCPSDQHPGLPQGLGPLQVLSKPCEKPAG